MKDEALAQVFLRINLERLLRLYEPDERKWYKIGYEALGSPRQPKHILSSGTGFNVTLYDALLVWLSEKWPEEGPEWPAEIARPTSRRNAA